MGNQLKNATNLAVSTLRFAFSEELAGEGESEGEEDIVAESLQHVVCAFIEGRRAALAHRADARNEADARDARNEADARVARNEADARNEASEPRAARNASEPRWYVLVFGLGETHELQDHRVVVRAYDATEAAAQSTWVARGACLVRVEPFEPDLRPEHKRLEWVTR